MTLPIKIFNFTEQINKLHDFYYLKKKYGLKYIIEKIFRFNGISFK